MKYIYPMYADRAAIDSVINFVVEWKYRDIFDNLEIEWFKIGVRALLKSGAWPCGYQVPE